MLGLLFLLLQGSVFMSRKGKKSSRCVSLLSLQKNKDQASIREKTQLELGLKVEVLGEGPEGGREGLACSVRL